MHACGLNCVVGRAFTVFGTSSVCMMLKMTSRVVDTLESASIDISRFVGRHRFDDLTEFVFAGGEIRAPTDRHGGIEVISSARRGRVNQDNAKSHPNTPPLPK
jgi:hypothetical protein